MVSLKSSRRQRRGVGMKSNTFFPWTSKMDQVLSARFIVQMNQGNRNGKFSWNVIAWTDVISTLRKQFGVTATVGNIESHLFTWDNHYRIVSHMLSTPGFSWDYLKGRVDVSDERVWNDYVKSHPEAMPYRRRLTIRNWGDICTLFGNGGASGGKGAQTAAESEIEMTMNDELVDSEETMGTNDGDERGSDDIDVDSEETVGTKDQDERSSEDDDSEKTTGTNNGDEGGSDDGDSEETAGTDNKDERRSKDDASLGSLPSSHSRRQKQSDLKGTRKRKQTDSEKNRKPTDSEAKHLSKNRKKSDSAELQRILVRIEDIHGVLTRMADSLSRFSNPGPPKATAQMVFDELAEVEDLDQTIYLKAVDLLMEDQRKFDTFVGLPNKMKRRYILLKLGLA